MTKCRSLIGFHLKQNNKIVFTGYCCTGIESQKELILEEPYYTDDYF